MWADNPTTAEVESTLDAANQLATLPWASPLLARTRPIIDRLRLGHTNKGTLRTNPLKPSELSFLFEIRFARELASASISAIYEYKAGVGDTTVDFRVELEVPWLVELVSLHESDAFKAATWASGIWHGYALGTNTADARQSEAGETIKAQERIVAKTCDRNQRAIKFPEPDKLFHMIMVDARGFLGDGKGDTADWHQIAYGANGLDHDLVKHWMNPRTREYTPIAGLFEPACPLDGARTLRARVHVIGFVCERDFAAGEIAKRAYYFCNPGLFGTETAFQTAISHWPLRRSNERECEPS